MAKGFQTFSWKGIPRQSSFRSCKHAWKAKSLSAPVFFTPSRLKWRIFEFYQMVYLELISPPGLLGYFLRVSVSTYREWSPFADKQPTSTHPIMTSHIQRLKSFKISFKNCPDHRTPLIFSEIAGTHQISWRTYLLKKDSKRLELCAQIVLFIPIRSNNRLSSLLRTFVRMIRMSASWPLANGATMCTDIKVKWTVIKMRLSCWAIPKKPLEKPMYFEYL